MTGRSLTTYLVEIAKDGGSAPGSVAARARDAVGPARFLRSIYVPEDDRWFLLYEGASAIEVVAAAERAELNVLSIAVSRGIPNEDGTSNAEASRAPTSPFDRVVPATGDGIPSAPRARRSTDDDRG